jgi:glycosyltransferase involved in cell wall biosynthesis
MGSFSIILETENLGMAGLDDLEACLRSLQNQSFPIDQAKEVLVVVGGHISAEAQAILQDKFTWLMCHLAGRSLEYTEAKVLGARIVTGDILLFADADVVYEKNWLRSMLGVFESHADAMVVGGDTRVYMDSGYALSLNLMWMLPMWPEIGEPERTDNFSLNNFAILRELMLRVPFPTNYPLYRGKVTVWKNRLVKRGCIIYRAPEARGYHAPPGGLIDWWYRMLIFGRDKVAPVDFHFQGEAEPVEEKSMSRRFIRFRKMLKMRYRTALKRGRLLLREDPRKRKYLLTGVPLCCLSFAVIMLGGLIACFNRDYLFHKINARERSGCDHRIASTAEKTSIAERSQ